jgi:hypothetical protein
MENLYCNTCKDYTLHEKVGLPTIKITSCSICGEVYDYNKKRYIICGPSNDVEVLKSRKLLLDKDPSVIIIDEDIALKHKLDGFHLSPKEIAMKLKTYPIMEDIKYSHLTKKEKEAVVVPVRSEPKFQRNDPCPCGSGKKYKKCCATTRM